VLNRFYAHMSYTYEHPGEAWMMLSLPLSYVLIGRGALVRLKP